MIVLVSKNLFFNETINILGLISSIYLSSSQLLSGRVITKAIRTINRRVLLLYIIDTLVYRGSKVERYVSRSSRAYIFESIVEEPNRIINEK